MGINSEQEAWPPKPQASQNSYKFDDLLSAKIQLEIAHGRNATRLMLIKELCDKSAMDIKTAKKVVYDYCDRKGVLPSGRASVAAWSGCFLIPLVTVCFIFLSVYLSLEHVFASKQHMPNIILLGIDHSRLVLDVVLLGIATLLLWLLMIRFWFGTQGLRSR